MNNHIISNEKDKNSFFNKIKEPLKLKPFLEIYNLKRLSNGYIDIDKLIIYKNEIFALLGSSGCGKSTLLRIIAGFESINQGKIILDGKDLSKIPLHKRKINMMFQSYALFPHMTVEQNIAFGLKQDNLKKSEILYKVNEMLSLVRMNKYAKKKPNELSGGQCQRVALARSIAKHPKLLLLDEPMGSLDKKLRYFIQFEILEIIKKVETTCIIVTHDQKEAMSMSQRIGIMHKGKIEQIGSPQEIYENPINTNIAKFIGLINIFDGKIVKIENKTIFIKVNDFPKLIEKKYSNKLSYYMNNNSVQVALRPEKITLSKVIPDKKFTFVLGKVTSFYYLGDVSIYYVYLKSKTKIIVQIINDSNLNHNQQKIKLGEIVYLYWDTDNYIFFDI